MVHTVRRLEAFSDIVIGFCLAQLGVNLIVPKSANDVLSVWASMTLLITAFIGIALLWWLYHRVFDTYFVLNTVMVIINFGMLCALILTMYLFESVVRLASQGEKPTAFAVALIIAFATVYELLGAMLLAGVRVRRGELSAADLRWAIRELAHIAAAVPVAAATIAVLTQSVWVGCVAIALAVIVVVARRVVASRWLTDEPRAVANEGAEI